MLKFLIFMIIFFSGFQFYALSTDKIFGISLEAYRQIFFIYLMFILISFLCSRKDCFNANRFIKDIIVPFFMFFIYITLTLSWTDALFFGLTDIMKFLYVLLVFLMSVKFVFYYHFNQSDMIIYKSLFVSFIIFLLGVAINIVSGSTVSPDTGAFLISGKSGRAIGSMYCSIISIYFYTRYLYERKKIQLFVFILSTFLVFYSLTRISILGFITAFIYVNIAHKKIKYLVFFSIFLNILLFSIITSFLQEMFVGNVYNIYDIFNINFLELLYSIRLTGREIIWPAVVNEFIKSLIFGNGLGHSNLIVKNMTEFNEQVHNDYLKLLSDTGIIGLILYLNIYLGIFLKAKAIYSCCIRNSKQRFYYYVLISTIIQILLFSFTDNVIAYGPYILIYVFIFYTLLISSFERKK